MVKRKKPSPRSKRSKNRKTYKANKELIKNNASEWYFKNRDDKSAVYRGSSDTKQRERSNCLSRAQMKNMYHKDPSFKKTAVRKLYHIDPSIKKAVVRKLGYKKASSKIHYRKNPAKGKPHQG